MEILVLKYDKAKIKSAVCIASSLNHRMNATELFTGRESHRLLVEQQNPADQETSVSNQNKTLCFIK